MYRTYTNSPDGIVSVSDCRMIMYRLYSGDVYYLYWRFTDSFQITHIAVLLFGHPSHNNHSQILGGYMPHIFETLFWQMGRVCGKLSILGNMQYKIQTQMSMTDWKKIYVLCTIKTQTTILI